MIEQGTIIHPRPDGTYVLPGFGHITKEYCPDVFAQVETYLTEHPESLVPEPVPPPPSAVELRARRIAEIKAEILALDAATIRPMRAGETDRVDEIEAQVVALRAELASLE
jgi:hypothetical protein